MDVEKKTVLLVEDNSDDVILTIRAFKKSGFPHEIVVARDGMEALEYLFGKSASSPIGHGLPTLVLLDLQLPRAGGLEVLQRIRASKRTHLLPVVILTTSTEDRDLTEGYALGANSYLRKPVDFTEFLEVVRRIEEYWLRLNQQPPATSEHPDG